MSLWSSTRLLCVSSIAVVLRPPVDARRFAANLLRVATLLSILACHSAPRALEPGPQDLEPGLSRTATIGVQARHTYGLKLEAGQYARLLLEQRGADVETTIRGPGGRALLRLDLRTSSPRDVEPIHFQAPRAGTYTVEVALADQSTAGFDYRLTVDVVRQARPADREAAAATRAFCAGRVLRRLADRAQGQAQGPAADFYRDHAVVELERAIVLAVRAEPFLEIYVREELAFLLRKHGSLVAAIEAYDRAWQRVFTQNGQQSHPRAWPIGSALAGALGDGEQVGKEIATWQALAEWAVARGEVAREATARTFLARHYRRLGRSDRALAEYQRSIEGQRVLGDLKAESDLWVNMGQALTAIGEQERALVLIDFGLAMRERATPHASDAVDRAFALNARGDVLRRLGRVAESLETFRATLRLLEQSAARPGQAAEQRRIRQRKAVALLGLARGFEADLLTAVGDPLLAWPLYQRARRLAAAAGNEHLTAVALASMGRLLADLGQPNEAFALLEEAVAIREHQGVARRSGLVSSLFALARARHGAGQLDQAKGTIERALEVVESLRELKGAVTLRSAFLESKQQYYDLYIEILMALEAQRPGRGYAVRALETAERRRARSLGDRLATASEGERVQISPSLRAEEHRLWQELLAAERDRDRLRDRVRSGGDPLVSRDGELRDVEAELEQARLAYDALESRLRQQAPDYRPARPALSIEAMRAQLDDSTLLLVYNLGERASHVWVLRHDPGAPDALTSYRLAPRHVLEPLIDAVWQSLQGVERRPSRRESKRRDLEILSATLLPPSLAAQLDRERLLVVKDGALHSLPFGALTLPPGHPQARPGRGARLIAAHEIVVTPSVGVLAQLRQRSLGPTSSRVAVIADAVYQRKDRRLPPGDDAATPAGTTMPALAGMHGMRPRLTGSRSEGEGILAVAPPGSRGFFGLDARRELLLGDQLVGFGYLHLAVHGDLRFDWPVQAALVLSEFDARGASVEGRVTAGEIQRCRLDAHTVVLSACSSGLGRAVRGEGLVGLSHAFLVAGAHRTLVSLWPIGDRATRMLMVHFYEEHWVRGLAPGAALRASQLWMARQPGGQAAGSWAGFEIHGDWRGPEASR